MTTKLYVNRPVALLSLCDLIIELAGKIGSVEMNDLGTLESEVLEIEKIASLYKKIITENKNEQS